MSDFMQKKIILTFQKIKEKKDNYINLCNKNKAGESLISCIGKSYNKAMQLFCGGISLANALCDMSDFRYFLSTGAFPPYKNTRTDVMRELSIRILTNNSFFMFLCHLDSMEGISDFLISDRNTRIRNVEYQIKDVFNNCYIGMLRNDEFIVIDSTCIRNGQEAAHQAMQIQQAAKESFKTRDGMNCLKISIGYCKYPDDALTVGGLLRRADSALCDARFSGADGMSRYRIEVLEKARERQSMMVKIQQGLNKNEFEPWFQPRVATADGEVTSVEALARWVKGNGVIVPPLVFIPIAEETGLIVDLGARILEKACETGVRWIEQFGMEKTPSISVNVSVEQLRCNFVEDCAKILKRTGFPAGKLEIEVTESVVMNNVNEMRILIDAINDMGVKVSVDDFGTGYSSLSYLHDYRFSTLKIDASFIRRIDDTDTVDNHKARSIVVTLRNLAENLNLSTVAEGVETQTQLDFLKNLDCTEIQGYYYAKPMPEDEFDLWIKCYRDTLVRHSPEA